MADEEQQPQQCAATDLRAIVDELIKLREEHNSEYFNSIVERACTSAILELSFQLRISHEASASPPEDASERDDKRDVGPPPGRNIQPPLTLDDIKDFVVLEIHPRRTGEKAMVLWRILRSRFKCWI